MKKIILAGGLLSLLAACAGGSGGGSGARNFHLGIMRSASTISTASRKDIGSDAKVMGDTITVMMGESELFSSSLKTGGSNLEVDADHGEIKIALLGDEHAGKSISRLRSSTIAALRTKLVHAGAEAKQNFIDAISDLHGIDARSEADADALMAALNAIGFGVSELEAAQRQELIDAFSSMSQADRKSLVEYVPPDIGAAYDMAGVDDMISKMKEKFEWAAGLALTDVNNKIARNDAAKMEASFDLLMKLLNSGGATSVAFADALIDALVALKSDLPESNQKNIKDFISKKSMDEIRAIIENANTVENEKERVEVNDLITLSKALFYSASTGERLFKVGQLEQVQNWINSAAGADLIALNTQKAGLLAAADAIADLQAWVGNLNSKKKAEFAMALGSMTGTVESGSADADIFLAALDAIGYTDAAKRLALLAAFDAMGQGLRQQIIDQIGPAAVYDDVIAKIMASLGEKASDSISDLIGEVKGRVHVADSNLGGGRILRHSHFGYVALETDSGHAGIKAAMGDGVLDYDQFTYGDESKRVNDNAIAEMGNMVFSGKAVGGIRQYDDAVIDGENVRLVKSKNLTGDATLRVNARARMNDVLEIKFNELDLNAKFHKDGVDFAGKQTEFDLPETSANGQFEEKFYGANGRPDEVVGGFRYDDDKTELVGAYGATKQ